jgi:hypothetical protein
VVFAAKVRLYNVIRLLSGVCSALPRRTLQALSKSRLCPSGSRQVPKETVGSGPHPVAGPERQGKE